MKRSRVESSGSDADSANRIDALKSALASESESVLHSFAASASLTSTAIEDDSDDEEEWEAVDASNENLLQASNTTSIEVTLATSTLETIPLTSITSQIPPKRKGITKEDRQLRHNQHAAHLLTLFASLILRNAWCNSSLLKHPLFLIVPAAYKKRTSNPTREVLKSLHAFWQGYVSIYPKFVKTRYNKETDQNLATSPDSLESLITSLACMHSHSSSKSHTLSHHTSSLLFTTLCRSLGLRTRLVAGITPIPLSFATKIPVDPFYCWSEVYLEGEWVCVDTGVKFGSARSDAAYVIAFEAEYGVKDVTNSYSSDLQKLTKLRLADQDWLTGLFWLYSTDKASLSPQDHLENAKLASLQDSLDEKDAEVDTKMPTTIKGFEQHPTYTLERHCKKCEIVFPRGKEYSVGMFNGMLVYLRSHVRTILTAEAWVRQGFRVKLGQHPAKVNAASARSKRGKREQSLMEQDKSSRAPLDNEDDHAADGQREGDGGREEDVDGEEGGTRLYGEWQIEVYVAELLIDGIVPRNTFNNFELFHPRMLPYNAVHIDLPGVWRQAKKLSISHANALIGFKFGRHTTPIISGIICAAEHEVDVRCAWGEDQKAKVEKAEREREKIVLGRWSGLVRGVLKKDELFRRYLGK